MRCASDPICPYRFAIFAVVLALQPMMDATTESEAPRSSSRVQAVCLRSWNLLSTLGSTVQERYAHEPSDSRDWLLNDLDDTTDPNTIRH